MHATNTSRLSVRYVRPVLWVLASLALLYLIVEHPKHLLGWWPFLALMACPFMHLFMHRGHGSHGH
jgi:hypothetical protein